MDKDTRPEDIAGELWGTFGNAEQERSAWLIVRFCQKRGRGWEPFTINELDLFYQQEYGKNSFPLNDLFNEKQNQIEPYLTMPAEEEEETGDYRHLPITVSPAFIAICAGERKGRQPLSDRRYDILPPLGLGAPLKKPEIAYGPIEEWTPEIQAAKDHRKKERGERHQEELKKRPQRPDSSR